MRRLVSILVVALIAGSCSGDPISSAPSATDTRSQSRNLAVGAMVTASASMVGQPTAMINDGVSDVAGANFWGSGGSAPQWVEFDLGAIAGVQRVVLLTSQSPAGPTVHELLGRASSDEDWRLLIRLSSKTSDNQTLVAEAETDWDIRYLRIETTESPSWVSWGEIEIWGNPGESSLAQTTTTGLDGFAGPGADLILHNGRVITADSEFSVEHALAVTGGLVEAVGSDDQILPLRGSNTRTVDLHGATVLPGIVDPHIHMIQHEAPDQVAMTAAHDALIASGRTTVGIPGVDPDILDAIEIFEPGAALRMRLYVRYNTNCGEPPPDPDFWRSFEFDTDPAERIAVAGVKVFADGGSCHGPAVTWDYPEPMPEGIPFDDWVGNGSLFITSDELAMVVSDTEARGGQVVVHAAGERAVVTVLDGMELALGAGGNPQRHRMDHNDFVPPDQRSRYGDLGVTPVVFGDYDSCFAGGGMWTLLAPEQQLGWHRANRFMIEANPGLPVAWHSDLPFTALNIFAQLQSLVTVAEVTAEGGYCSPPAFLADQGVDVEQAILMMTWNAAYAMNLESFTGSLEPGKWADLIVVAENPLDQPVDQLYRNTVWMTMIDGRTQFCDGPAALCDPLSG